jgi:hypothetical protein
VALLQWLTPHILARVERGARAFRGPLSLVEQALRQRAAERAGGAAGGRGVVGAVPVVVRSAGSVSDNAAAGAGHWHSAFIDEGGQLLTCGAEEDEDDNELHPGVLGHGPEVTNLTVPTPVPSLCRASVRLSTRRSC